MEESESLPCEKTRNGVECCFCERGVKWTKNQMLISGSPQPADPSQHLPFQSTSDPLLPCSVISASNDTLPNIDNGGFCQDGTLEPCPDKGIHPPPP